MNIQYKAIEIGLMWEMLWHIGPSYTVAYLFSHDVLDGVTE